ncbi:MAG: nucleoside triphosphate pyrophosphohydrolase [Planctomycetota bacterium]
MRHDPVPLPALARLRAVIAALRTKETGCPWDLEQTRASMAPHLLEETYEALEAIEAADDHKTREELGDVLMNVFLIARIAEEDGGFDIETVADTVADKLVRRHPHVFGDDATRDPAQVLRNWEAIKRAEAGDDGATGVLAGVPRALPALLMALRVGEKASRVGFDWPDQRGPRAKVDEELAEFDAACAAGDREAIAAELGDLLFSLANLARHLDVNPEMALRACVARFRARFTRVEEQLRDRLPGATLAEMEAAWQAAKATTPPSPT